MYILLVSVISKMSLEERALAWIAEKGGEAIERKGPSDKPKHIWVRCAEGHVWRATKDNLAYHHWCAECHGNAPHTIEMMQELAKSKGGKCLSDTYSGLKGKLLWECKFGHQWEAIPNNVKNLGSWCRHCNANVGEELVRSALQEAFPGKDFDSTRREPWCEGLELDGFNEELRLAFEYQGIQHYRRVLYFHPNEGDFEAQQSRDAIKRELCTENEYYLLEIPYTIDHAKLRDHIRVELGDLGYTLAPKIMSDTIFNDTARVKNQAREAAFARAKEIIASKGGICLSTQYLRRRDLMQIQCKKGHVFEMCFEGFSRGDRFCQVCGGTKAKSGDELKEAAESCGYTFISVASCNDGKGRSRRRVTLRCPKNHLVEMAWDNFKPKDGVPKRGCKECADEKKGGTNRIDGAARGKEYGLTLLDKYKNRSTNCQWRCEKGHTFVATLVSFELKAKKSEQICTECELEEFADANDLTLETPWTTGHGPTAPLVWKCNLCDLTTINSRAVIAREKITVCEHCERIRA
jgi:hypothetical protein